MREQHDPATAAATTSVPATAPAPSTSAPTPPAVVPTGATPQPTTTASAAPAWLLNLRGREVAFTHEHHAQAVADQWNEDHAGRIHELVRAGYDRDAARLTAAPPRLTAAWDGPVWDRLPARMILWSSFAWLTERGFECRRDAESQRWIWEFNDEATIGPARWHTSFQPLPEGNNAAWIMNRSLSAVTEAHATGLDRQAVADALEQACAQARAQCGQHPDLWRLNAYMVRRPDRR